MAVGYVAWVSSHSGFGSSTYRNEKSGKVVFLDDKNDILLPSNPKCLSHSLIDVSKYTQQDDIEICFQTAARLQLAIIRLHCRAQKNVVDMGNMKFWPIASFSLASCDDWRLFS